MSEQRVIPISEVIEALEGPFDGQRVGRVLHRASPDDRCGYCCIGVMAKLVGVDDVELAERGMPQDLPEVSYRQMREAYPWINEHHQWVVLSGANDRMDFEDRSYSAPIAVLRAWNDES